MDLREQSESRIGQTWTTEDHAELCRKLSAADRLVQDVYQMQQEMELVLIGRPS